MVVCFLIVSRKTSGLISWFYFSADERVDGALDRFRTKIVVSSNGLCKWLAPIIISSSCKIDVKYFPFDKQVIVGFTVNVERKTPTIS